MAKIIRHRPLSRPSMAIFTIRGIRFLSLFYFIFWIPGLLNYGVVVNSISRLLEEILGGEVDEEVDFNRLLAQKLCGS